MKHERTVRECTYRASDTAPPCVVLVDPDPLSPKRFSHTARWTWSDEEALFFASLVLEQRLDELQMRRTSTGERESLARMADTIKYLSSIIDPDGKSRKFAARKKRLTPKRKGA